MSEDLIKFVLPAEFVLEHATATAAELVYGYRQGWIDNEGAVRLAEEALRTGDKVPRAIEDLALLLRDEQYRVPELIAAADKEAGGDGSSDSVNPSRLWLYLALQWLHDHRADFVEPLQVIEQLYADFDYPPEIESLVRFMPASPGQPVGSAAIEQRWSDFLHRLGEDYSARRL